MREDPPANPATNIDAPSMPDALETAAGTQSRLANAGIAAAAYLRGHRGLAIWLVLVAEGVVWTALSPEFLTLRNITDILRQGSLQGIVAVGGTFVLLTGEIDLTVGSLTSFAGIVAAGIMTRIDNTAVGMAAAIGIGLLSGLTVGLVTTRARVPSFIVTLAGLEILAALTLLFANGATIPIANGAFQWFGFGYIGRSRSPSTSWQPFTSLDGCCLLRPRLADEPMPWAATGQRRDTPASTLSGTSSPYLPWQAYSLESAPS